MLIVYSNNDSDLGSHNIAGFPYLQWDVAQQSKTVQVNYNIMEQRASGVMAHL